MRTKLKLKDVYTNLDTVVPIIVAITVAVLGLTNVVTFKTITTIIVALLGSLAFGFFKNQIKFEQLQDSMNKIINSSKNHIADNFFSTKTDEKDIISHADKKLLFIQETGSIITETARSEIITFLGKGGIVKIIVTLPDNNTSRLMALRNANIDAQSLIHRGSNFQAQIKNISQNVNEHIKRLEVRYLPYPIGITAVIADPDDPFRKKRKAIIRFADFNVPFEEKLDFTLDGSESERTFLYYYKQFEKMNICSHKFILLTGLPRTGKSTVFSKLIQANRSNRNIYFVSSKEIKENNERVGFEVITSDMSNPVQFAWRNDNDTYNLQMDIWAEIARKLIENKDKIIILDEIGPMQLGNDIFKNTIIELLENKETTVFSTIAFLSDEEGYIERIKRHYRTTNFMLNENNRDTVLLALQDELNGSIELYNTLYDDRG